MTRKHPAGLKRLAKRLAREVEPGEFEPDAANSACIEGGEWDNTPPLKITPIKFGNIDEDFDAVPN